MVESLKKDSRVTSVRTARRDPNWDEDETFYPILVEDEQELLSGTDRVHSTRFGSPIAFTVHVPGKNQPRIHGEAAHVDTYEVAWDGWTAVVAWLRPDSDDFPPTPAGQVVADILRDALDRLGHSLLVQACSPACTHLFGHRDMRVSVWNDSELDFDSSFESPVGMDSVDFKIQGDIDPAMIAVHIALGVSMPAAAFARMKNSAKRILNLERSMRGKTSRLLAMDYVALMRADVGFWRGVGNLFQDAWAYVRGRGRERPVKRLISELWLQMAAIETLQRVFEDAKRDYQDAANEFATPALFDGDLKDDEASVKSIDAGFARAAIENKSARMDSRGIVVATLIAAVIGSGIGAAVGGLFT